MYNKSKNNHRDELTYVSWSDENLHFMRENEEREIVRLSERERVNLTKMPE